MKNVACKKIKSIEAAHYSGPVYNIELQSHKPASQDDLFWVCNGVVVHNCFPKDINALMHVARKNGVEPTVMKGVWEKNLDVRPPAHRDWEKQVGRAVSKRKANK